MRKVILLFTCLLFSVITALSQGFWTQLADVSADGRHLSAGFAVGDYGYVCGGKLQNASFTTDLYRYDPVSGLWAAKAGMPFGAADGVSFVLNGKAWFTTGYTTFGGLTELYSYNPTPANTWSVLTSFPGPERNGAVAFSFPTRGIAGLGGNGAGVYYTDIYEYNSVTGNWTPRAGFPGTPRSHCAYFTLGTKGYILGGQGASGFLPDVWEYDAVADTWTQKADFPGAMRVSPACFTIGAFGYIMGGETALPNLLTDFWQYNSSSDSWSPMTAFPGNPRKSAAAFSVGGKGYVACGMSTPTSLRDLWSFTPSGVGINDISHISLINVYPNPSTESFTVSGQGSEGGSIELCLRDITGKTLYAASLESTGNEWSTCLNMGNLSPGIYFLQIQDRENVDFRKIEVR